MYHLIIKKVIVAFLLLLLCILCTSCWSSQALEEQIYVSAVGVDYEDEEYTIYAQVQNFQSIIEFQPRSRDTSAGSYVGVSTGKTLYEAALNLTRSSQAKIDWGHIEALVVTEEVLKRDGISTARKIYRYPDTRYNSWFYVTNESIYEIFITGNIYDESSLSSLLFSPEASFKQKSTIKPLLTFQMVANLSEPDRTVAIPVLKLNKNQWKSPQANLSLLEIGGAFFTSMHGERFMFELEELQGFRLTQMPSRTKVSLQDGDENQAEIVLRPRKKKIEVEVKGTEVFFTLNMDYLGGMYEFSDYIPYKETLKKLEETVSAKIRESYMLGVEKQIDILNLMPTLRQKHPDVWNKLTENGKKFILDENSLANIKIKLRVPYNGKYKRVPEETD